MVIDFHTHTFPDTMAEKTIMQLSKICGITPQNDSKRSSLLASMRENGIDRSVVLPVATSPKQESSINALSAELNGRDGIFYAGGIHPDCADVCGTLDFIKESGLFGIKLHPDYQGVHFDDPRYVNIMREAAKRGLYIVTHAGIDVSFREHVHCTPDMILNVLGQLGGLIDDRLILAHMGSYEMPGEVLDKICGKPVYMDTAAVLDLYPEKCFEIIRKHGADRILFATDSPWKHQGEYRKIIENSPLDDGEKQKILSENAERILFG